MAQALVKWLCAQRTVIDGAEAPLYGGMFAIFGHGKVASMPDTAIRMAVSTARNALAGIDGELDPPMVVNREVL